MIPILMAVFALGGTTFGMAEESLAFYALIITVMIAAGYDALIGAAILLLGCGIGVLGLDDQPVRDRDRVRASPGRRSATGWSAGIVILVVGTGHRHLLRAPLRRPGARRTRAGRSCSTMKAENETRFRATERGRRVAHAAPSRSCCWCSSWRSP